jgi:hypothetical protein
MDVEAVGPTPHAGRGRRGPPPRRLLLEDEARRHQPVPAVEHTAEQRGGHTERWVRHDVEVRSRQSQVTRVRLHHDDRCAEPRAQVRGASRMRLDGDHPRAGVEQARGDGSVPGADVEDERSRRQAGVSDEVLDPRRGELMPSPSRPWRAHGDGPRRRRSCARSTPDAPRRAPNSQASATRLRFPSVSVIPARARSAMP